MCFLNLTEVNALDQNNIEISCRDTRLFRQCLNICALMEWNYNCKPYDQWTSRRQNTALCVC